MKKAWYYNIDWSLLAVWALLAATGLVAIYSATHGPASEFLLTQVQDSFDRQAMWMGISAAAMLAILLVPSRWIDRAAIPVYLFTLALAIATIFIGVEIKGARRWIPIGPFSLQSTELLKVGALLIVAKMLAGRPTAEGRVRYAFVAVGLLIIPFLVSVGQNDTGTGLLFLGLVPVVLFWAGMPLPWMALLLAPVAAVYLAVVNLTWALYFAAFFTAAMLWVTRNYWMTGMAALATGGMSIAVALALTRVLKPHQISRIVAFTDPEAYRLTSGFHVIQSKAAIGSGGLTGQGYMQGSQTQMAYIPEQNTDFIFTVIGEEFGFIGAAFVLMLFAYLLIRLAVVGYRGGHPFVRVFAASVAGLFLFHLVINIGMTVGLMPVMGIPLPLVSYGGSALLANSVLVAIALNLYARRDEFAVYRAS
jgi:rod shape determining protein RodA